MNANDVIVSMNGIEYVKITVPCSGAIMDKVRDKCKKYEDVCIGSKEAGKLNGHIVIYMDWLIPTDKIVLFNNDEEKEESALHPFEEMMKPIFYFICIVLGFGILLATCQG